MEPVHPSIAVYIQRSIELRHNPPFGVVTENREQSNKRASNMKSKSAKLCHRLPIGVIVDMTAKSDRAIQWGVK